MAWIIESTEVGIALMIRAQNNYLRPACHYDRPQHKMTDPGLALPATLQRSKFRMFRQMAEHKAFSSFVR